MLGRSPNPLTGKIILGSGLRCEAPPCHTDECVLRGELVLLMCGSGTECVGYVYVQGGLDAIGAE